MATQSNDQDINVDALSKVLAEAKIQLDEAVRVIQGEATVSSLIQGRLRALADNNSTCNTACTCGAVRGLERSIGSR